MGGDAFGSVRLRIEPDPGAAETGTRHSFAVLRHKIDLI
jgi:hypothetical protein